MGSLHPQGALRRQGRDRDLVECVGRRPLGQGRGDGRQEPRRAGPGADRRRRSAARLHDDPGRRSGGLARRPRRSALGAFPRRGAGHPQWRGGTGRGGGAGRSDGARCRAAARRSAVIRRSFLPSPAWRLSPSSLFGWLFMRGQGPASIAATPPAQAPSVPACHPCRRSGKPATASRSSGTGRWRKKPARRSRPIWSAIPTGSMRNARATRCSPAAPRPMRSGSPGPTSPTRWCAASPAARCRPA